MMMMMMMPHNPKKQINQNYASAAETTPFESRKYLNLSRSSYEGTPSDPYIGTFDEYLSPQTRSALRLAQAMPTVIVPTPMDLSRV